MKSIRRDVILAGVCALSFSMTAQAAFITFNFEAEVTRVGQVNSFGGTAIGDTFSGSYTFNSTVSDSPVGFYDFSGGPPIGLTAQVGTESVALSDFRIRISNDTAVPNDTYVVSGNTGSAQQDTFFIFGLVDSTSSVFTDHSLPLTPPLLSSFDIFTGEVRKNFPTTLNPLSEFRITSLTLIPIPAAVWLFVSGLLGLLGLARLRRAT